VSGVPFAVAGAVAVSAQPAKKYGVLTVEGHIGHKQATGETLHVYLDGVDITGSSYWADDVSGEVRLYCRDAEHHRQLDAKGALHMDGGGGVCRMLLKGHVVIAPGPRL
jgi:hypothetical protein